MRIEAGDHARGVLVVHRHDDRGAAVQTVRRALFRMQSPPGSPPDQPDDEAGDRRPEGARDPGEQHEEQHQPMRSSTVSRWRAGCRASGSSPSPLVRSVRPKNARRREPRTALQALTGHGCISIRSSSWYSPGLGQRLAIQSQVATQVDGCVRCARHHAEGHAPDAVLHQTLHGHVSRTSRRWLTHVPDRLRCASRPSRSPPAKSMMTRRTHCAPGRAVHRRAAVIAWRSPCRRAATSASPSEPTADRRS